MIPNNNVGGRMVSVRRAVPVKVALVMAAAAMAVLLAAQPALAATVPGTTNGPDRIAATPTGGYKATATISLESRCLRSGPRSCTWQERSKLVVEVWRGSTRVNADIILQTTLRRSTGATVGDSGHHGNFYDNASVAAAYSKWGGGPAGTIYQGYAPHIRVSFPNLVISKVHTIWSYPHQH